MNTTKDAAKRLGITPAGVVRAITRGSLPAKRFGNAYVISDYDLNYYAAYISRPRFNR